MGSVQQLAVGLALSPTWMRAEGWRRPDSRADEVFSLAPFADLARAAEAAGVDFLFKPDAGHLDPSVIGASPGFSTFDSTVLLSVLAGLTERIGLVPTVQTTFDQPFATARSIASLHRLSEGRAGWNVVTAIGGYRNHGVDEPPSSIERYRRAADFVTVVRRLWASYPAEALIIDRATGRFADGDLVREIDTTDTQFSVAGPNTVAADPSGEPPLFQAGGSPAGLAFAGSTADAVFGAAPTVDSATKQRTALRVAAEAAGRDPDSIRFLPGLAVEVTDTPCDPGPDGSLHWSVRGSVDQVVDQIARRHKTACIDGFIALGGGGWTSVQRFVQEVLPRLSDEGITRGAYSGATLREHLFPTGQLADVRNG